MVKMQNFQRMYEFIRLFATQKILKHLIQISSFNIACQYIHRAYYILHFLSFKSSLTFWGQFVSSMVHSSLKLKEKEQEKQWKE